jgi:uncharacterized membrane protein YdjX (TVP38/TMEM64 family)
MGRHVIAQGKGLESGARFDVLAETKQGGGRHLTIVATVALVIVAFGAMLWLTSDPARRQVVEQLVQSPIGLLVLFGLAALSTATLILPAPGLALTAVAGASGEPLLVGVVAGLGQALGELTGYAAGRGGRSLLPDNPATRNVEGWLASRGVAAIFVLALVPNPLFDVAGIAAGVLRMPVRRYLAAAAAGKVIKNVIVAGGASTLAGLAASILVAT